MKNKTNRFSYTYRKAKAGTQDGSVIKVYVFRGDEYIGWDCFSKTRVYIGKSKDADLVLDDPGILDTQAILSVNGDLMTIFGQDKGCGVSVNGSQVTTSMLEQFDFITIGPYTLKVKLQKIKEPHKLEQGGVNTLSEPVSLNSDASFLKGEETYEEKPEEPGNSNRGKDAEVIDELFSSTSQLLLDGPSISEIKQNSENISEVVSEDTFENISENISEDISEDYKGIDAVEDESDADNLQEEIILPDSEDATKYPDNSTVIDSENSNHEDSNFKSFPDEMEYEYDDDEEDDDEEDLVGLFSLKDKLLNDEAVNCNQGETVLEVVKFRQDTIFDIQFLDKNDKYYITTSNRKEFCIAEHSNSDQYYFYFNKEQFTGKVIGIENIDIANLSNHENLYNKRKSIYRYLIPSETETSVILSDGYYEYSLRRINKYKAPKTAEIPKEKNPYYKYLTRSGVFHIIILFVAGLFFSISPPPEPEEPESRFVKVDTRQLSDFKKRVVPIKKKPKPQLADKPAKKTFKKRASSKVKTTRKKTVSRSPKAGGGSKNGGNIVNRNVNVKQAGILSALGISDGIGLGAKDALAAVTNLDAVRSSNSKGAKLKVAGLVGKLGDSKVEVPSVGLVNTKGSTAVIRSAGIEGNGRIAALEKGKTGQSQVMAMVSADLSKTVRIQGGMSREAVKKVIDQHMDEISYCYETALIADPALMGKAIFEWKILMPGTVGEVRIKSSSIKSTDIHSCIKSAIKSWQFPVPKGAEVMVSYPFIFDVVGF